ncbi:MULTISPECIES: rhomboid family intramembrane serine protease [Cyanophyceae]|uniref:rhomboid family intramembrane serine protease n=1 Tax=Cyanophyceae TaxID=3028117 RepID=UPI0016849DBC|nr:MULTISPECIES: rhomboid family intramembrane serine protease [unclassified Phormidium]MBD1917613.1 rhomboid family intramembrane serine protease [Phormidium sp. FACHB-77]MBD2029511.1 rhomboid family intramembrane serine protease [Phormidium sp. FACHB-322]MBD2050772.1 rhomboid family intramembrane serine protease [Leptolyngbya sp. FACHB-60]
MSLFAAAIALFSFDQIVLPDGFRQGISLLAYLLALMWALAVVDFVTGRRVLNKLSIAPRSLDGLPGIAVAPLLHGDFGHLAANSGPLVILGTVILLQGLEVLGLVTVFCWVFSGVGIWLLGRPGTRHLGASGVVFGYLGYLLLRGYFERSPGAIAAAVIVGLLYGSALWGLLPLQRGKSWVGHGMGFLGGVIVARKLPIMLEWVRNNSGF